MIPWVSGKCILSACTSRRFRPLSAVAVLFERWMNPPGVVGFSGGCVVSAISSLPRRVGRGLGRGLLLDRLDHARVADLLAEVRVDEPAATGNRLRAPAARLVIGFCLRDVDQLWLALAADVAAVLAARLELASDRRLDQ